MSDYEALWRETAEENKWLRDRLDLLAGNARENPTIRDQFAMAALTSMLAPVQELTSNTPELAATLAYEFADAMLEARKEKK